MKKLDLFILLIVTSCYFSFGCNSSKKANQQVVEKRETENLKDSNKIGVPQFISVNSGDYWKIRNLPHDSVHVKIFNRWGNVVYENENYDNTWKGQSNVKAYLDTSKNEYLPGGTYFYTMDFKNEKEGLAGYVHFQR